jgi:hypothetical protein
MADVPYSGATSGAAAREEITKLLRRIGCDRIGFMDEYATSSLLLAFEIHGRPIQMKASAKGWAEWWLRENPWNNRRRGTNAEWRAKALAQGMIAINSILRDWCKGQVTAIECGMMPAEAAFLAHMLTSQGVTVLEMVDGAKLLAPPTIKN